MYVQEGRCESMTMTLEQFAEWLEELKESREIIKTQRLEIDILIRKNDTLRDMISEQQAEIERLKKAKKDVARLDRKFIYLCR